MNCWECTASHSVRGGDTNTVRGRGLRDMDDLLQISLQYIENLRKGNDVFEGFRIVTHDDFECIGPFGAFSAKPKIDAMLDYCVEVVRMALRDAELRVAAADYISEIKRTLAVGELKKYLKGEMDGFSPKSDYTLLFDFDSVM